MVTDDARPTADTPRDSDESTEGELSSQWIRALAALDRKIHADIYEDLANE